MERGVFDNLMIKSKIAPSNMVTTAKGKLVLRDPMFKISRLIGFFNIDEDLKVSHKSLARGIILFLLMDIERAFFIVMFISTKDVKTTTFIFVIMYNINWLVTLFRSSGGLIKALGEFSLIVQKLEVTYKSSWIFVIPFCLMLAKFVVTATGAARTWQWLFEVAHLLMSLQTILLMLQYSALTRHCAQAFTVLHKKLSGADDDQIQKLAAVHCRLCRLTDEINCHFGPSILVTVCLIIALSMLFTYVYVFNNLTVRMIARRMLRIGYILVATLCVIAAATQVRRAADEFNNVLRNILIYRRLRNEDKLRVYVEMGVGVTPTACGFFNLKPTLIITIVAGLISYIVILLQFSGKSKIPLSV